METDSRMTPARYAVERGDNPSQEAVVEADVAMAHLRVWAERPCSRLGYRGDRGELHSLNPVGSKAKSLSKCRTVSAKSGVNIESYPRSKFTLTLAGPNAV